MNHDIIKRVIFDQHEIIQETEINNRHIQLEEKANYILVGLRRSGKSTLLYQRVKALISKGVKWEQIIYINFDDNRLDEFSVNDFDDILLTAEELSSEEHYFYFDEIQNVDGWEDFIAKVSNQNLKIDITGSNAKMLSKELEHKLANKFIIKEILPYDFEEYLAANQVDKESTNIKDVAKINKLLGQYFIYGGFPASLMFKDKREYVSSIYQKILFKDILTRNKIRNTDGITLLIRKIAESTGNDISFTKLKNEIDKSEITLSKDTIINYVSYFKEAFLLFSIENYYAYINKKSSNPKYYFRDNGILNLLADNKNNALLENIIAIYLYQKYKDQLYYFKGSNSKVNFYLEKEKVAIYSAYSLKDMSIYELANKNLVNLSKSSKEKIKMIIVTYEEEGNIKLDEDEIKIIPLKKFLLDKEVNI